MSEPLEPTAIVRNLPATRPFVAPEELAKLAGIDDLLRLGANESAFGVPPGALAAMARELPHSAWYGDPESADLRAALARRHGCTPANITVGAGIDDLLGLLVRGYLAPGDVSVAARGTYPTYAYHVRGYGAVLQEVGYRDDGRVDLDGLLAIARTSSAKLVYLANPDNPSGTFAARETIEAVIDRLPEHALLVLDEAYADFVERDELVADRIDPRVIRMRTFSKAYGLAGARVAYALATEPMIAALDKIRVQYAVNRTAQIGALAALAEDAFIADVRREVARGRDAYAMLATQNGLRFIPSRANFLCIDLGTRERAEAMVAALLALGVFVRKPIAPPLDRYIRVTVGTANERARFGAAFSGALVTLGPAIAAAT